MPRTRFFPNKLADYKKGSESQAPTTIDWIDNISGMVDSIVQAFPQISNSDGGLYAGNAGIAYMLYYISNFPPLSGKRDAYLSLGIKLLEQDLKHYANTKLKEEVSFLLGPAGVYVLGGLLGSVTHMKNIVSENVNKIQSLSKTCLEPQFLSCGSDELFVGRTGYLCGVLNLEKKLGMKVLFDATINAICEVTVNSGKAYAKCHRSKSPLMYAYYESEYLGAAHGLSSILQVLLSCPSFIQSNSQAANDVKQTVDWMLSIQQENGNFAPATDELGKCRSEELVHWCHGAPGVVYLFAKAYHVWKDECYLEACVKCGELTWNQGLLRKGPGICHGVAGSGYVFLLLYRLTGNPKHLHRAQQFANFLFTPEFQSGARTPDCPYSLYEGLAGTVCFLVDLQQPEKAEFPFFNIF